MAVDKAGAVADATTEQAPPKRIPTGVVLGKDGKPCRNCTSFAAWAAQTKSSLPPAAGSSPPAAGALAPPPDCPPDVDALGRGSWALLHSIAAQYPPRPSAGQQSDIRTFLRLFATLYPCWTCAEDFQAYLRAAPVRAGSRAELGTWLCEAHNDVNRKLGKPTFDCARWEERWRTGWKDGRCG